ncbi:MAG: hypothetical protein QM805_03875 [Pseudomonas sp.]
MHPRVLEVTQRIQASSASTRQRYLDLVKAAATKGPHRGTLPCGNLAHGVAACGDSDKQALRRGARRTLPSSPRTTTCSRRTSRWSASRS